MRLLNIFIILLLTQSCSFDNKSGIWNNENKVSKKDKILFKDFKKLSTSEEIFNKEIKLPKNFIFNLSEIIQNNNWSDTFYSSGNNFENFSYANTNKLISKSKNVSRFKISEKIFKINNYLILSDVRGNIIFFAIDQNKLEYKFNFYKKKYKKVKKNLNFIIENEIIYVSDNIGYIYSYNFKKKKILWAKNFKIPFRSNLKIFNESLIVADQNNSLYFLDKRNGNLIKLIPTEETTVKNNFINNLSIANNYLLYLNSYGSLYSINLKDDSIAWFINLNQATNFSKSNLFFGSPVIASNNKAVVSSNNYTYILDIKTGGIINKKNYSSLIKPIIIGKYLFTISKKNLLICTNINNGKIIYSYDINKKLASFINTKRKNIAFKELIISNNEIFIFLKNSHVLNFDIKGDLKKVNKLPSKLKTHPIVYNNTLVYSDFKNKIFKIN